MHPPAPHHTAAIPGQTSDVPRTRDTLTPTSPADRHHDRVAVLLDALEGIDLTDRDHRILAWLADWDDPTIDTIASLVTRARGTADRGDRP